MLSGEVCFGHAILVLVLLHRKRFFRREQPGSCVAITYVVSDIVVGYIIRASVDALCRDGTSEISRDPRTKRLQTRRESLAMPSKHTNNNF